MTLEEVAERLGRSPNTIRKNFKRTQETLEKQGVLLIRNGTNDYSIVLIDGEEDKRILTISQLIGILEEWKEEIGDVKIYKLIGDTTVQEAYRVFPVESSIRGEKNEGHVIVID